jgi:hypothetical protein
MNNQVMCINDSGVVFVPPMDIWVNDYA